MGMKILKAAVLSLLFFLIMPHVAYSQENGEAQTVIVERDKRLTLRFGNKEDQQRCGFFVGNRLMNQEQALAIRVAHLHYRFRLGWGSVVPTVGGPEVAGVSLPEHGWLYITRSRI